MKKVLVVLVIIALLLGLGWFVWHDFLSGENAGSKISGLNTQLQKAQDDYKAQEQANKELKGAILALRKELIRLDAQKTLEGKTVTAADTAAADKLQLENIQKAELESADNHLPAIQAWVQATDAERKEMNAGRKWFSSLYNAEKGRKDQLAGEIAQYKTKITQIQAENKKLGDEITRLKQEIADIKAERDTKVKELAKLQGECDSLDLKLKSAEEDLGKARGEKAMLEARAKKAEADLNVALGKNADLAKELAAKKEVSAVVEKTEADFTKAFDTAVSKAKTATKVELTKVAMLEYRHYFTRYVAWLAMAGTSDELTKRIGPAEIARAKVYLGTVLNEYSEDKEYEQAQKFMGRTPKSSPEKIYAVISGYWSLWQKARSEHQQACLELEKQDGSPQAPLDAESEAVLSLKGKTP